MNWQDAFAQWQQQTPPGDPQGAPGIAGGGLKLPGMGAPGGGGMPGAGLPQELISQLLSLRNRSDQQGSIDRQRKLANALRGQAQDQLQGVQAGRIYRAPGIANLAANVYAQYKAGQQDSEADAAQKQLGQQGSDAAAAYFKRLTGG